MREIVHIQAGQCGNQMGAKVSVLIALYLGVLTFLTHWFKGAGSNCFPYKARNDHPIYLVQYYYKRNPKLK
jgi:hypothetical protein